MNRRSFFQRLAAIGAGAAVASSTEVRAVAALVPPPAVVPRPVLGWAHARLQGHMAHAEKYGIKVSHFECGMGFWEEYDAELRSNSVHEFRASNPVWDTLQFRGVILKPDMESGGDWCHAYCNMDYQEDRRREYDHLHDSLRYMVMQRGR